MTAGAGADTGEGAGAATRAGRAARAGFAAGAARRTGAGRGVATVTSGSVAATCPGPRPLLSRRQTMPARQARRPATSGVSRPQAATHLDRLPPPHAWHRPAKFPQILTHRPAPGLMTFCQFASGTFGNVAAGTQATSAPPPGRQAAYQGHHRRGGLRTREGLELWRRSWPAHPAYGQSTM